MEIYPVDILIYVINITLLFVALRFILWKPVYKFLEGRQERIKNELANAESARINAEEMCSEYERQIEEIEAKGREILRESQTKAADEADELIKDARARAEHIIHDAHGRIADERERAVINARHEVAQIATDMASRILKREVSSDDNKAAVDEFFKESR